MAGKVTVDLVESNGSLPPGLLLGHKLMPVSWQTAKKPASAPCSTLVIEYGITFTHCLPPWCYNNYYI